MASTARGRLERPHSMLLPSLGEHCGARPLGQVTPLTHLRGLSERAGMSQCPVSSLSGRGSCQEPLTAFASPLS